MSVENERGSKEHSVLKIILHPDWNSRAKQFDADISVIVLHDTVQFSGSIRQICLPQQSYDEVVGTGTVVGWGRSTVSENSIKKHSATPNQLEIPAVSKPQCFADVPDLAYFSSNRTFCAGFIKKSKSTCAGDDGGGFYLEDTSARRFILAGVTSASLDADGLGTCETEAYTLFTNVARFVDWINSQID